MERAVASFEREASGVLSDKLGQISDAGTQRLEKRLGQIAAGLERQRDDAVAALERRLAEAEEELMRRVQALTADVDADRTVIQARLTELGRRIDETYARAR
jgi:ABC-type Fe2+-enterobactin transport system substrate-binding protein